MLMYKGRDNAEHIGRLYVGKRQQGNRHRGKNCILSAIATTTTSIH